MICVKSSKQPDIMTTLSHESYQMYLQSVAMCPVFETIFHFSFLPSFMWRYQGKLNLILTLIIENVYTILDSCIIGINFSFIQGACNRSTHTPVKNLGASWLRLSRKTHGYALVTWYFNAQLHPIYISATEFLQKPFCNVSVVSDMQTSFSVWW